MDRLRIYPWLFALTLSSAYALMVWHSENMIGLSGIPIGADYITYWSASQMAEHGRLADSYDVVEIRSVQQLAAPVSSVWGWFYPPTFAMLLAPITSSNYLASFVIFSIFGLLIFTVAILRIAPPARLLHAMLLAPAIFINLGNGQNAALTAGIAGLGLSMIGRQPIAAGLLLGVLTFKPQLALPLVFLLAMHREYQALAGVMITTVLLATISVAIYGWEPWWAWLGGIELANQLNTKGQLPWHKMSSLFSFLRAIDWSIFAAQIAQAIFAVAILLWTWKRFKHLTASPLRHAAWCAACLTLSPHLFNYDMLWLVPCLAWLAIYADAFSANTMRWLMPAATLIWIYPLAAPLLQTQLGLTLEWLTPLLMLWILHHAERNLAKHRNTT